MDVAGGRGAGGALPRDHLLARRRAERRWPARGTGFDAYVEQIGQALDALQLQRAVICGVSYGGLVAAAFAAAHPERVAGLALVSAIPPSWAPDARARFFMRSPGAAAAAVPALVAAAAPRDRRRRAGMVAGRDGVDETGMGVG
jgi:pimeloyl-ACP methyl ester carboxylesterase